MSTRRKPQHRRHQPPHRPSAPATAPTATRRRHRGRNVVISSVLVVVALLIGLLLASRSRQVGDAASAADGPALLVRPDSRTLTNAPEGAPVFVEFIDYECESCRAVQPTVDDLVKRYGDRVLFVVRTMPLHTNSVAAAKAAEAAAEQGRYSDMVDALFRTQPEWGEKTSSQEEAFFSLAAEIGLDMDRFRLDFDDPNIIAKIERDRRDGKRLGVRGTPTFFLNGELLDVDSVDALIQRFEDALGP